VFSTMKTEEEYVHECRPWFAICTRHQHEKTAAHVLTNKGFEVFLPLHNVKRRWRDRDKTLALPLFPCYVFLHGDLDRRLDVLVTPGVNRFVEVAGRPAQIPENEILMIREAIKRNISIQPHPYLKFGDWVRVRSGPLEGFEGILVRQKSGSRLVLSVELLGKAAAVEVDLSTVEPIARRPSNVTWGTVGRAAPAHRALA
jgi:transcription antitermination factor NusG